MRHTPVCDEIAAELKRFQLRLWLKLAAEEKNFDIFRSDRMRIQGYLDALEDEGCITSAQWGAATGELTAWLQEWVA